MGVLERNRRADGTINLLAAFYEEVPFDPEHDPSKREIAGDIINAIEKLRPISSRQAAAIVVGLASAIAKQR